MWCIRCHREYGTCRGDFVCPNCRTPDEIKNEKIGNALTTLFCIPFMLAVIYYGVCFVFKGSGGLCP